MGRRKAVKKTIEAKDENINGLYNAEIISEDLQISPSAESTSSMEDIESYTAPDWTKIERIDNNSFAARWELEKWSVIREFYKARVEMITFYMKPEGGNLSMEEAIKLATRKLEGEAFRKRVEQVYKNNIDQVSWYALGNIFRHDPLVAEQIWEDIKEEAEKDFKSGHLAAKMFERTEWQRDPWKRAQFIAIREGFVEQFKPTGAIDCSMVDMLAVTYSLWMHWTELHIQRSTTDARREPPEWVRDRAKMQTDYPKTYEKGYWDVPYISESAAIEQAALMADRYRRAYQSQLRAMRDWRRYNSPVTINNPQQVNIAGEGGQQVNVQAPKKKKASFRK